MQKPRDTIIEIVAHKATSMIIGISVVAMFGIPLLHNLIISVAITSLTLGKDYFLRRYFYNRSNKKLNKELAENRKKLEDMIEALASGEEIPCAVNVTNEDLMPFSIEPFSNLNSEQTIIIDLLRDHDVDSDIRKMWKNSPGLRLVTEEDDDGEE